MSALLVYRMLSITVVECDCTPLVPVTTIAKLCGVEVMNPPRQPETPARVSATSAKVIAHTATCRPRSANFMRRLIANSDNAMPNEIKGSGPSGLRGSDTGARNELFTAIAGIWMVRIDAALLSPGVALAGLNVAVAPAGRPAAVRDTGLLYEPPTETTTMA